MLSVGGLALDWDNEKAWVPHSPITCKAQMRKSPVLGTSVLFSREKGLILYPPGLLLHVSGMSRPWSSTLCEGNHIKRQEAVSSIRILSNPLAPGVLGLSLFSRIYQSIYSPAGHRIPNWPL